MQVGGIQSISSGVSVAKASSTASYDPRDTNQDGVVSATEALVYALEHPELAATANAASFSQYDSAGALATAGAGKSTQLDQYA